MHLRRRTAGIILGMFMGWNTSALAQDMSTLLSPPVAQGSTDVPYPPDAQGNAVVVLELVVDIDGSVVRALVKEGAEPFAEQARRAVLAWRFVPAHRGSSPVAARIRARVEFHQEEAAATSSATDAPTPAPSVPAPAAVTTEEVEAVEVTVHGARHEIGQTTLATTDFREMPGAFGNPFRAIQALPGVTPVVSGLPFFYIRGAPPNDNAYFVDDIRVPLTTSRTSVTPGAAWHVAAMARRSASPRWTSRPNQLAARRRHVCQICDNHKMPTTGDLARHLADDELRNILAPHCPS